MSVIIQTCPRLISATLAPVEATSVSAFYIGPMTCLSTSPIESTQSTERRTPLDFLRAKGGPSEFGNNSVSNFQLFGTLHAFSASGGTYYWSSARRSSYRCAVHESQDPYQPIGISWDWVLDRPKPGVYGDSSGNFVPCSNPAIRSDYRQYGLYLPDSTRRLAWWGGDGTDAKKGLETLQWRVCTLFDHTAYIRVQGFCIPKDQGWSIEIEATVGWFGKTIMSGTNDGVKLWKPSTNQWVSRPNSGALWRVHASDQDPYRDIIGYRVPSFIKKPYDLVEVATDLLDYLQDSVESAIPVPPPQANATYSMYTISLEGSNLSESVIQDQISKLAQLYADVASIRTLKYASPTNLYVRLYDAISTFSSNLIAYTADIKKTGDTLRSLLSLVRNPKDAKKWASAWLSYRYGDRLMLKDSIELIEAIRDCLSNAAWSKSETTNHVRVRDFDLYPREVTGAPCTFRQGYRVWHMWFHNSSNDRLQNTVQKLIEWDAWPTLENTWDLIPLSFVVDWLIPVNEVLHEIDSMIYSQYLKCDEFLVTYKVQYDVDPVPAIQAGILVSGLTAVFYNRDVQRSVPVDYDYYNREVRWEGLSLTHCLDGLSLFLQFS